MSATSLGGKVRDALLSAGIRPYRHRGDGFEILGRDDDPTHVVVTVRTEGALYGTGSQVARQMLGRWIRALEEAGYAVELIECEGDPLGLVVAADEPAKRRGVEAALASVAETSEAVA